MVSLLDMNYNTRFALFFVSDQNELNKLPTHSKRGEDVLSTVYSCAYGSLAKCENGDTYILSGNDTWTIYKSSNNNSNTGGSTLIDEVEPIPNSSIKSLFP